MAVASAGVGVGVGVGVGAYDLAYGHGLPYGREPAGSVHDGLRTGTASRTAVGPGRARAERGSGPTPRGHQFQGSVKDRPGTGLATSAIDMKKLTWPIANISVASALGS